MNKKLSDNNEEKYVLDELCKYFKAEPDEIFISKFDGYKGIFKYYRKEYRFFINEEIATELTIKKVEDDIFQEPELFSESFLESYISVLPADIETVIEEMSDMEIDLMSEEDVLEKVNMLDEYFDAEEQGLQDKMEELLDEAKILLKERICGDIKKELTLNPARYLADRFGYSMKEIIELPFIKVDVDQAAEDAVSIDGWINFWDSYDGYSESTEGGIVFFRIS